MVAERPAEQGQHRPALHQSVVRLLTLSGIDYITSDQRQQFSEFVGGVVWPVARLGAWAVEFMIYGSIGPDHEFIDARPGPSETVIHLRKVRTMAEPEAGTGRDIDRFSSRILNWRAHILRAIGLDELLNIDALRQGQLCLVGPRPQQAATMARLMAQAAQAGVPKERIDGWKQLLDTTPRGLFGDSQLIGRVKSPDRDASAVAAAIIESDLRWRDRASFVDDLRSMVVAVPRLAIAGIQVAAQQLLSKVEPTPNAGPVTGD